MQIKYLRNAGKPFIRGDVEYLTNKNIQNKKIAFTLPVHVDAVNDIASFNYILIAMAVGGIFNIPSPKSYLLAFRLEFQLFYRLGTTETLPLTEMLRSLHHIS